MTERRTTIKVGEEELEGFDVPIEESIERWTELKLEDGAVLRMKVIVSAIIRIDSKKDPDGNPLYMAKSQNAMALVSGPTKLGRKVQ